MLRNDNKGSALTMVLFAFIGLGVMTYMVMENKKITSRQSSARSADRDIEEALAKISALLLSPADCNANLRNKNFDTPASTPITQLNRCVGGNCNGITGAPALAFNLNNWVMIPTEPRKKARIYSVNYSLAEAQSTSSLGMRPRAGYPAAQPAIIRISIIFEKNNGIQANSPATDNIALSRTRPYEIDAFVVTSRQTVDNTIPTDNPTHLIYGCARSPASTFEY